MILADTSIWIHHFREGNSALRKLLEQGQVLSHPFVIGEVAMGSLERRDLILGALQDLPKATVARDEEVLQYISNRALFGLGIGYVDAHLLAAVQMTAEALLWTRDKRLASLAAKLSLAFSPTS
jgi:predicted nucleic acid-binding protein